jgi:hypothetical protein
LRTNERVTIRLSSCETTVFFSILTTVLGGKAVDAVISLGFLANETAESVGGEGTSVTAGGVDITDVDLD